MDDEERALQRELVDALTKIGRELEVIAGVLTRAEDRHPDIWSPDDEN